jgi:hypothetical protein
MPDVDAESTLSGQGRMKVHLVTWMRSNPGKKIQMNGEFCRTDAPGAYEWRSKKFSLKGHL